MQCQTVSNPSAKGLPLFPAAARVHGQAVPPLPERHTARTTTLGPSASQPRAASSRGIVPRGTTRRRW